MLLDTGVENLDLGGVTRFGDEWLAVGSGGLKKVDGHRQLAFDVRAFRSTDGRTWSAIDTSGLGGPADVSAVASTDDAVVAVGTLRTATRPPFDGFEPVAWHSADGQNWTTVPLPTEDTAEGGVQGVVAIGAELLAVGGVGPEAVMWSSTDGGRSWAVVQRDGIPVMSSWGGIVVHEEVLVASGTTPPQDEVREEGGEILVRSDDGGRSWREVNAPPPQNRGESFAAPLFVGGGRFFTVTSSRRRRPVEPGGLAVAATDSGRVVAFQRTPEDIATWSWPAGVALRTRGEPVDPTTDVELLGEAETPEPGRRYGVALYIHCGMDWLYIGGDPWQRTDDGPDTETGAGDPIPEDWPVAQQTIFGFVTLVDDNLIEYSIGNDEVIATYAPASGRSLSCD